VHDSVPVSINDKDNIILRSWGNVMDGNNVRPHYDLLYMIGGYEPQKSNACSGHRFYYLTGMGLYLNLALINYGSQFLHRKGYKNVQTPYFIKKEYMKMVSQLEDFQDTLYKIEENNTDENEDKYLIATSEQPLCTLHMNQYLSSKMLPIKYSGYSTCFRREAGSRTDRGLFRVHQFEKIEQFVITAPNKSWEMLEEMISVSEEFYQSLGIPYRVVSVVSGELNHSTAKKYDLEAWFPASNEYRELVSCSNCTDFQSKKLKIVFHNNTTKKKGTKTYVHMLNSTLCASQRTLCCLLENYQTPDGIKIPDVLLPYMIPYLNDDSNLISFIREAITQNEEENIISEGQNNEGQV